LLLLGIRSTGNQNSLLTSSKKGVSSLAQGNFFKLTNHSNVMKMKSAGNPKAIDFYAGLKLDQGPLNPGRKLWTDAVKEENLRNELNDVGSLRDWERSVLKDADPKFNADSDSSDNEDQ